MIEKMVMELCNGVMGGFIRDSFMKEYSMEKVSI